MDAIPGGPDEVPGVIEHNIFHRAVAIGPARDGGAGRGHVLDRRRAVAETADASSVDLPATVALVAEILEAAGEQLEAGDRIIAGTLTPPQPVRAGRQRRAGPRRPRQHRHRLHPLTKGT